MKSNESEAPELLLLEERRAEIAAEIGCHMPARDRERWGALSRWGQAYLVEAVVRGDMTIDGAAWQYCAERRKVDRELREAAQAARSAVGQDLEEGLNT